jgi:hypothetical protein
MMLMRSLLRGLAGICKLFRHPTSLHRLPWDGSVKKQNVRFSFQKGFLFVRSFDMEPPYDQSYATYPFAATPTPFGVIRLF